MWKVTILCISLAGYLVNGSKDGNRLLKTIGKSECSESDTGNSWLCKNPNIDKNFDNLRNEMIGKVYLQPKPTMRKAPRTPFLPLFIGFQGYSIQSYKQLNSVSTLIDMSQKLGNELDEIDVMVEKHTLTSFNNMVKLIRTMSENQINNVTNQLHVQKNRNTEPLRFLSWGVFRDAVIQAGTGPAMASLKKWIQDGLVSGEEAAQLVSTIVHTVEFPTEELMKEFFELVKQSESSDQIYIFLNSILAFGSLIKKVYVCKKSMKRRFPIDSFGEPIQIPSKELELIYIPYLEQKLKHAVAEADSLKTQVYIKAIGNTAHPKIISIFKSYINGQKQISNFQRLLMITSLDAMAIVHPTLVRSLLYEIYINMGEKPDIRTAAVSLIMRTNPSFELLLRMAEATNWDSSEHVNAAVKSAIKSAAANVNSEMGRNARKALNILTTKSYSIQSSSNYIRSFLKNDEHLGYSLRWTHNVDPGSAFPSYFFFILRPQLGGFSQRAYKYSWMTTSFDGLMKLFTDQIHGKKNGRNETKTGAWTSGSIAEMLGLKQEMFEQVEGNLYFTLHGARRFMPFDNNTIKIIPKLVKYASSAFRIGDNLNYTKMYNQFSLRLGFPTATGLPFVFTLEAPTVASIVGNARLNSHPDFANGSTEKIETLQSFNLTSDFKALFSSKIEAQLGFVTPFNHKNYLVGYDSDIQINLPLKIQFGVDVYNRKMFAELRPLNRFKYHKIAEFSTLAYTSIRDIIELSPPQLDASTKTIHIKQPIKIEKTVGNQMTGFAFDLKAETEQNIIDYAHISNSLNKHDILSAILFFDKKKSIDPSSSYSISYNPMKTTAKFAKIHINYADVIEYAANGERENQQSNDAIPNVSLSQHKKIVEQLMKRSSSGMRDSYAQAFDLSVEFKGNKSAYITVAGAYARSYVSQRARYLLFFSKEPAMKSQQMKPFQIALDVQVKVPNVPLGNFKEAVKVNTASDILALLNFGEKAANGAEIIIKGQLEKSQDRIDYLTNLSMTKLCEKQMNESNYFLHACHRVTTRANFMNQHYFRIDYQNVTPEYEKSFYNVYSYIRNFAYPFVSENTINQRNPEGRVELDMILSADFSTLNVYLIAPSFSNNFVGIELNKYFKSALAFHPHYSLLDRMHESVFLSGHMPRCVVDGTHAVTFDNVTYPIYTGRCWHVMLQFNIKKHLGNSNKDELNHRTDFSVLIRETKTEQRELMLVLGDDIVRFHATSGKPDDYFTVNDQTYEVSREILGHFEDVFGTTLVQAYKLSTGIVKILTPVHGVVILYDGLRIEIQISNHYRGKIRGLCGTFNGERSNDFTIPKNCILRNPLEFAASYAITDKSCLGPANELRHTAQTAPCYEQGITFTDVNGIQETVGSKPRDTEEKILQTNSSNNISMLKKKIRSREQSSRNF